MIDVFRREGMGRTRLRWLDAHHHFSFADYVDPERIDFGALRVWNDDLFHPGGGFPMHPHRDMEIVTLVLEGAITHEDSLGHRDIVKAGELQVMSAGSGIIHSEFNHGDEDLELFQIWIRPDRTGIEPRYETRAFPPQQRRGRFVILASGRDEGEGGLLIHQDATLLAADLAPGGVAKHALDHGRRAYVVPVDADVEINGTPVPRRAGAKVTGEAAATVTCHDATRVVLLDLE
jgi:redox-sensitive bicupin YhaK (pirin superfamily)